MLFRSYKITNVIFEKKSILSKEEKFFIIMAEDQVPAVQVLGPNQYLLQPLLPVTKQVLSEALGVAISSTFKVSKMFNE